MKNCIVRNHSVVFGRPTLKGTRLTVLDIVYGIYLDGLDFFIKDREITYEEAKCAIIYCMGLECQKSEGEFCNGCILDSIKNGYSFNKQDFYESNIDGVDFVFSNSGDSVYLGTMKEFEDELFGRAGWGFAEMNYKKYLNK